MTTSKNSELTNRELLVHAILAFDLMVKDCIEAESEGKEFHETAFMVLRFLAKLLMSPPDSDHLRNQYLLNVTEISARIKLIFSKSLVTEDDLEAMLGLQAERLKWLGKQMGEGKEGSLERNKVWASHFIQ